MPQSFEGKTAIVTGAGSGINLAFAKALLSNGANVVIGDLALRPEAQTLINDHGSINGARAIFHRTDVTSWSDLSNLFQKAEDEFGSFDIVCPGAGIYEPPFSSFWNFPGHGTSKDDPNGDRYKSIDVDLVHPIRATQLAITHYLSSKSPASSENPKTVLIVSSIASEGANPAVPLYATSKWGLRGFIYTMAHLEQSRHIRVVGVAPGVTRTPGWFSDDKKDWVSVDGEVQDEWITAERIGEVMLQLCTETEISDSKGNKVPVSGGSLIEVLQNDVRDVPMWGAGPPGTGTDKKGLMVANIAQARQDMNDAIDRIAEPRA